MDAGGRATQGAVAEEARSDRWKYWKWMERFPVHAGIQQILKNGILSSQAGVFVTHIQIEKQLAG